MSELNRLIMLSMAVNDMAKSKEFYEKSLGFKVIKDYGQGDMYWVSMELPGGGTNLTLTTAHEKMVPGSMKLYISSSDINAAQSKLVQVGASDVNDDLYGPGSGVKWFSIYDPDGNNWIVTQS